MYPIQRTPLDPVKAEPAVQFLRKQIMGAPPEVHATLLAWMTEDPENWATKPRGGSAGVPRWPGRAWHFEGGMVVRNSLRAAGFGDDYFGCNLDDVYIELVEAAVRQGYPAAAANEHLR